jgi:choline monooxygenase
VQGTGITHPGVDDRAGVSAAGRPASEPVMPATAVTPADRCAAFCAAWQGTPLANASGLPAWCYEDPAFFRREQERFFARTWLHVAHDGDLPSPHGWLQVRVAGFPILLTRDRDGTVRAFHNVCPHRGAPLGDLADPHAACGAARTVACPYHGWVFRLDGALAGAPGMAADFDRDRHALRPLRLERWGPFWFVNLSGDAQPLTACLGPAVERFAGARLDAWVRAHRVDYTCHANWKFYVENNAECYHEPVAHHSSYKTKEVSWNNDFTAIRTEVSQFCYFQYSPYPPTARERTGGLPPGTVMPDLDRTWMEGSSIFQFWPNFAWILNPNLLVTYLIDPIDERTTRIRWDWMVPDTPEARDPAHLEPLIRLYDRVQREDMAIFERLQEGLRSPAFAMGALHAHAEKGVHRVQSLLMEHLGA